MKPEENLWKTIKKFKFFRYLYGKLLENRTDVNEGDLLAISEYHTNWSRRSESLYAAWVKPDLPYDVVPENIRVLSGHTSYVLISTDRIAMEDFLLEVVYGVKNRFD